MRWVIIELVSYTGYRSNGIIWKTAFRPGPWFGNANIAEGKYSRQRFRLAHYYSLQGLGNFPCLSWNTVVGTIYLDYLPSSLLNTSGVIAPVSTSLLTYTFQDSFCCNSAITERVNPTLVVHGYCFYPGCGNANAQSQSVASAIWGTSPRSQSDR